MTQFSQKMTSDFRFQFLNGGNEDPPDTFDEWFVDDVEVISTTGEDPGLRAAIAEALGLSPSADFYASDLGSIAELDASGMGIRDIKPREWEWDTSGSSDHRSPIRGYPVEFVR